MRSHANTRPGATAKVEAATPVDANVATATNRIERRKPSPGLPAQLTPAERALRSGLPAQQESSVHSAQHAKSGLAAQPPPAAMTVVEFCCAHRFSRALFYLLVREGRGPRLLKVGRRTLITLESAAEWRGRMEASTREAVR